MSQNGEKLRQALREEMTILLDLEQTSIVRRAVLRVSDRVIFDENEPGTAALLAQAYAVFDNVFDGLNLPRGDEISPLKITIAKMYEAGEHPADEAMCED